MSLNPSDLLIEPRAATRHATKIPPPAFLGHDLHFDWGLITTVHANLLLIGSSPETRGMLDALEPHFREPIGRFRPMAGVILPEQTRGTLIVLDADGLDSSQQAQMLRWMNQRQTRVQVVCTSRESLFRLVEAGDFLTELYYRLNVVLLDLTPA